MIRDDFCKKLDSINRDIDLIDDEDLKLEKELNQIYESDRIKNIIVKELDKELETSS